MAANYLKILTWFSLDVDKRALCSSKMFLKYHTLMYYKYSIYILLSFGQYALTLHVKNKDPIA